MAKRRRIDMKALLADADLRRELMVSTIQATQAREGIETTRDQADRAYYVVTESDKAAFFDLERFRGGKRSTPDRREEMFVRGLRELPRLVRFDVARRDFGMIEGSPLAYRRVGLAAHVFREMSSIEPSQATVVSGLMTVQSDRIVRMHWEVPENQIQFMDGWTRFAKGGDYSRFYRDTKLLVDMGPDAMPLLVSEGCLRSREYYGQAGLTWVPRTQRGFNVQYLPPGIVFGKKGPIIMPKRDGDLWAMLALLNSVIVEYLIQGLMSFGSYEVGVVQRVPMPRLTDQAASELGNLARSIYDAKALWDAGNETSTHFEHPWLLSDDLANLGVAARLDRISAEESTEESRIQELYAAVNDEAYRLYGISAPIRKLIEETMGERPPELLWPDMERKSDDQKRMEQVWRLLSYVVKRIVEADGDGIVPFVAVGGEAPLVDRVRAELDALFPNQDLNRVEVGITNELKRRVKGYRRVESLEEWLRDEFFEYHTSLYQSRSIFWHIASSQVRGQHAFGAIVHYHKFDYDRLAKLRSTYLRDAMAHFRREAGLADQERRVEDRQEWQAKLEEAEQLDRRLQWVQEGAHGHPAPGDCRIRTPWKSEDQQPKGWRPDLDDGVAVNIAPMQTAGVLRTGAST